MNGNTKVEPAPEVEPVGTLQQAQSANPPIGAMNSDDVRTKIIDKAAEFMPQMAAYHEAAAQLAALSVHYHELKFSETFGVPIEEAVLLITLDARETPKSLDEKLIEIAKLQDVKVRRIIFDRAKGHYSLFI